MKVQHPQKDTTALLRKLLGHNPPDPNLPALKYGRLTEPLAADAYFNDAKKRHGNLKMATNGLFVLTDAPYIGASPDRLLSCSCCGEGILEIKCPMSHVHEEITSAISCLQEVDGILRLKRKHEYYSQVIFQMGVTGRAWCDFVLYTKAHMFVERISFDDGHWQDLLAAAKVFFKDVIAPQLIKPSTL
jgi:hypothetical protein